jgi:hypothetical protein
VWPAAPGLGPKWPNFVGSPPVILWTWPMVVSRGVELVWLVLGLFSTLLVPDSIGKWPSSLGLMSDVYNVPFHVHFRLIFCIIPTYPPTNE